MIYYRQTNPNSCGAAAVTYYKMTTGVLNVGDKTAYELEEGRVYSSIKFSSADPGYNAANEILGNIIDVDYSNPVKMKLYLDSIISGLNSRFCIYQNPIFEQAANCLGIGSFERLNITDTNVVGNGQYSIIIVMIGAGLHYLLVRNNSSNMEMIDSADQNPDWKAYNLGIYTFTGAGILL